MWKKPWVNGEILTQCSQHLLYIMKMKIFIDFKDLNVILVKIPYIGKNI